MEEKFEIEQIPDSTGLLSIIKKFGPEDAPLKRILQIVLLQDCKTILIENNYEDREYRTEYERYYKHIFAPPGDKAKRLHFFNCKFKLDAIHKLSKFNENYLGFCVLRPFLKQKVAGAIIKPYEDTSVNKHWFPLCLEKFAIYVEINENNTQELTIDGFPFIQQDGQLGRCAHVSLATIELFLAQRHKRTPKLVSDIIDTIANVTTIESEVPGPGMSPYQISRALQEMETRPIIYCYYKDIKARFRPERVLYHYMESKLPILLGIKTKLGWHAITILGHCFEPDLWWALAKRGYYGLPPSEGAYHCSTTWIEDIIIHDDNFGPYMTLPKYVISSIESELEMLIAVPLPLGINVQGEDVEERAYRIIRDNYTWRYIKEKIDSGQIERETADLCKTFFRHAQKGDVVLRTYLTTSKNFKENIPDSRLKSLYEGVDMPEKIWLTEISIPELFSTLRLKIGEVVTDSTRSVRFGDTYLTSHLPGGFVIRNPRTGNKQYYCIGNDRPTAHMKR